MPEKHMRFERDDLDPDSPEMNMTPMIDVVFLLIIFFMVSYQLSEAQTSGKVELPVASHARPKEHRSPDTIIVEIIGTAGLMQPVYMIGGKTYVPADFSAPNPPDSETGSWQDLRALLTETVGRARAQMEPMPPVTLYADRRVQYKYVQHLMTLCAELGISRFSFEAKSPPED